MLKNLKLKVARKFYDVPNGAYLSDGEIRDACILTAFSTWPSPAPCSAWLCWSWGLP